MRRLLLAIGLALLPLAASAEVRVLAGDAGLGGAHIDLFFLNDGAEPAQLQAPVRMERTIGGEARVVVREGGAPAMLAPGEFAKVRYRIEPLEAQVVAEAPVTVAVQPPAAAEDRSKGFFGRFSTHEPVYALLGAGPLDAKVQVSAAYRPFSLASPLGRLRLAYTQVMFWALSEPSLPFDSISYRPELIYIVPLSVGGVPVELWAGLRHESNGESGPDNRSVNTLPLAVAAELPLGSDWSLQVRPEAWIYLSTADQNADIDDYRGHGGIELRLRREEGLQLAGRLIGSLDTGKGSLELTGTYPFPAVGAEGVGLYLTGQLFTGYGETLIGYDEKATRVRVGLSLVR